MTVNLIDRFLAVQPIMRQKFQLVGVTAMLIASKYEEISAPAVEDLILISDRAFTRNEVLQMVVSKHVFLRYFIISVVISSRYSNFLLAGDFDGQQASVSPFDSNCVRICEEVPGSWQIWQ